MQVANDSEQKRKEAEATDETASGGSSAGTSRVPPSDAHVGEGSSAPASPDWQESARVAADRARQWVVAHPFAALGVAVTAGFVVGRLVRR